MTRVRALRSPLRKIIPTLSGLTPLTTEWQTIVLTETACAKDSQSFPVSGRSPCMLCSILVVSLAYTSWIPGCGRFCQIFNHPLLTCSISDPADGSSTVNDSATLAYMQDTFLAHYNGNRQPFGLYTHPIHTAVRRYRPVSASFTHHFF